MAAHSRLPAILTLLFSIVVLVTACIPTPQGVPVDVVIWKDDVGAISALAVQPQRTLISAGNAKGSIRVWDLNSGLLRSTINTPSPVTALAYSPDGKTLASGHQDSYVRIWDVGTEKLRFDIGGASGPINALTWNSDGSRLVSASNDLRLRVLDMTARGREIRSLPGHSGPVIAADWANGTRNLVSVGDNKFIVWDAVQGLVINALPLETGTLPTDAQFSHDAKTLAVSGADGRLWLYALTPTLRVLRVFGAGAAINRIAWSPDSKRIAGVYKDKTIHLFDAATGLEIAVLTGHSGEPLNVNWIDNTRLISTDSESMIRLWAVGNLRPPIGTPTPTPSSG